jgi:hypothetical protein
MGDQIVPVEQILLLLQSWPERIRPTAFSELIAVYFFLFALGCPLHQDGQDAMTLQRPHSYAAAGVDLRRPCPRPQGLDSFTIRTGLKKNNRNYEGLSLFPR